MCTKKHNRNGASVHCAWPLGLQHDTPMPQIYRKVEATEKGVSQDGAGYSTSHATKNTQTPHRYKTALFISFNLSASWEESASWRESVTHNQKNLKLSSLSPSFCLSRANNWAAKIRWLNESSFFLTQHSSLLNWCRWRTKGQGEKETEERESEGEMEEEDILRASALDMTWSINKPMHHTHTRINPTTITTEPLSFFRSHFLCVLCKGCLCVCVSTCIAIFTCVVL